MTVPAFAASLASIDGHSAAIQVTGALALLLGFIQYGEAIRLGFRDRTHAICLVAVLFQLANDTSFTMHYDRWFNVVHHPFFMAQWYLIFPFTALELVVCWQIVHFSRAEVFPGFSLLQSWIAMLALGVAMFAVQRYFATTSGDYLSQKTNMVTLLMSNLGLYLLIRRQSARGQSMLLAVTLIFCAGFPQLFIHFPAMGPAFRTPEYYSFAAVVTATGLIYPVMLARRLRVERCGRAAAAPVAAAPTEAIR